MPVRPHSRALTVRTVQTLDPADKPNSSPRPRDKPKTGPNPTTNPLRGDHPQTLQNPIPGLPMKPELRSKNLTRNVQNRRSQNRTRSEERRVGKESVTRWVVE